MNEIQYLSGISKLVEFGGKYPQWPEAIIEDLQRCFGAEEMVSVDRRLAPGDEVTVAAGAFAGMSAQVLKSLPAKKRVRILLDISGTANNRGGRGEVVKLKKNTVADLAPFLAAPASLERLRV